MKKASKKQPGDDMLPEYDFSKGIRGKHAKRYSEGTNVVLLEPDVAKVFTDAASVNYALRQLIGILGKVKKSA
jgi:hypothetical protein